MDVNINYEKIAKEICSKENYTFINKVGEGSYKNVYQVKDNLENHFALKILKSGHVNTRYFKEIESLKKCNHPNISKLHKNDTFEDENIKFFYLVEDYFKYGTLDGYINKYPLSPSEILRIGSYLINAIGYLAEHELVHRDIKPANIMLASPRNLDCFEC